METAELQPEAKKNKHTLIIDMLVKGVQPVLQLIVGVCDEDCGLRSLWRRVDDGQTPGFVAC